MTFLGKPIWLRGHTISRPTRIAACTLALLAASSGLRAEPDGQTVTGDHNTTIQNLQNSQLTINNGLSPDEVRTLTLSVSRMIGGSRQTGQPSFLASSLLAQR